MKIVSGKVVATVGLLALMAVAGNFAQAQRTTTPRENDARVNSELDNETQDLQATADKAASGIQASPNEKTALINAVRAKNTDQARALLLRNGFTGKQLEGANIELNDETGGGGTAERTKVTVTIRPSCCPKRIVITIRF